MIFFYLSEGIENCKMSGKNQGKSGNFEVDDKWQPCYIVHQHSVQYYIYSVIRWVFLSLE